MVTKLTADLVLDDCVIGPPGSPFTSLAIRGGRIAAFAPARDMAGVVGPDTIRFDVAGRQVAPAFVDSHTHFHRASIMEHLYLNFETLDPRSIADVLRLVQDRAATTRPGQWIQGDSLNASRLLEQRLPTRQELDAVAPGRCVVLRTIGRHALTASSAALAVAGIDASTVAPPGGRIERDHSGEPTGVLHEHGKLRLDQTRADTVVPKPGPADRLDALEAGMRRMASHGIATLHDMVREPTEIADYQDLDFSGRLLTRVRMCVRGRESQTPLEYLTGLGLRPGFGSERLRLLGVKMSIDGDLANRNAAVYGGYPGEPENVGLLRLTGPELTEAVTVLQQAKIPAAIHAIGPRAVDMALDAIAEARRLAPEIKLNHRIEHAFYLQRGRRLERFAELGVVWSTQASMLYSNGDSWLSTGGAEIVDGVLPLRTALAMGVAVQLNSDYPCSPLSPVVGLRAAVDRKTRDGLVLSPEEAITPAEAMALMTTAPAAAAGEADHVGRVEVGQWADLIVLGAQSPVNDLAALQVDATIVGGDLVYERSGTPTAVA
jgi:predicted amidohydrolase YtcJ